MNRVFIGALFAVLWTLAMWWINRPLDWMPLLILAVCGALAGFLFAWLSRIWMNWIERRNSGLKQD